MRRITLAFAVLMAIGLPAVASDSTSNEAGAVNEGAASETVTLSPSQKRADELDMLFARLHGADGSADSRPLEQKIWSLWSASDSPTAEALLQQGTRAMDKGAPKESLSILTRLVGTYPDFAEGWNRRATLYYLMKRDDEALLDIQRVLDLEPRHFGALAGRGLILQRKKNYSGALEAFERALRLNPGMDSVKNAIKELQRHEQSI